MNSKELHPISAELDPKKLPVHVAIIPDGNGRWAKKRLMNRIRGHEKGMEAVRQIVTACRNLNISILTLYVFSTENWKRPKMEVTALMSLLKRFLASEKKEMMGNNIKLHAIGQTHQLPDNVRSDLEETIEATSKNDGMLLNLALSYGGRAEIVDMVKSIAGKVSTGEIMPDDISSELISDHLYTSKLADPDLLIRTSGEMRISNFLLWQIAYTEIYVTKTLWPDFGEDEFFQILMDYQSRDRRYGAVR